MKLHYSQTKRNKQKNYYKFDYHMKLHYSQTNYEPERTFY